MGNAQYPLPPSILYLHYRVIYMPNPPCHGCPPSLPKSKIETFNISIVYIKLCLQDPPPPQYCISICFSCLCTSLSLPFKGITLLESSLEGLERFCMSNICPYFVVTYRASVAYIALGDLEFSCRYDYVPFDL